MTTVGRDRPARAATTPSSPASPAPGPPADAPSATEVERLAHALAAAHHDLTALVTSVPIPVCRIDADGNLVIWNPAAERTFGWSAEEVLGGPLPIVHPDDADDYADLRRRALTDERPQGEQVTCVAKDGSDVQIKVWTSVVERFDDDRPDVVGILVDVTEDHRAEMDLRESEHRWRTLVQNVSDVVSIVNADGRITSTVGEVRPLLGYPSDAWDGIHLTDVTHPDDVPTVLAVLDDVLSAPGNEVSAEARVRHHDGTWAEIWVKAVNLIDDPTVGGIVLTTRNITDRKRAERLVRSQTEILELIARDAPIDQVLDTVALMIEDHDPGARVAVLLVEDKRLRPRARRGRGPGPSLRAALGDIELHDELVTSFDLQHGVPIVVEDVATDPSTEELRPVLVEDGVQSLWWAPVIPMEPPRALGAVIAFHEDRGHVPSSHAVTAAELACSLVGIALERHTTTSELTHRSLHDDLTNLPNRTLLLDRLQTSLDRAHRSGGELTVLYVDIDLFKMVNDSLGHKMGDEILKEVADRLRAVTRPGDTIARVGADEFVIVCDRPGSLSTILSVADRLTEAMSEPFAIDTGEVFLTVSLGLALSTPGTDGAGLLRNADAAMARAKQRGRNRLEMYDSAMQASAHDRLNLSSHLRRAISRGEMRVVYQPIVELETGSVVGAEALVRWRHPTRGEVPPAVFVPVAEETGTILEIGEWVLETALSELREYQTPERQPFQLSVNLSARQLDDPGLVSMVTSALRTHQWPAEQLCLELTETALTEDLDSALRALIRLRATGTRIAVDDFGTGYSSLTHLQRLPIDAIKIDRSFVQGLGETGGTDRSTIATAVLGIAHAMGLDAVAEGVETPNQLHALRRLGCPLGQGYLFSVPVPADALSALVVIRS